MILLLAVTPALWLLLADLQVPQFGMYQDDGLLWINAKSLSEGRGFRILSLPGEPYQTKYQPLLPRLLSPIWTLNPKFPEHLGAVAFFEAGVFVAFIWLAAALFRWAQFSWVESAGLAAFLALSPLVIFWAAIPTADYLFAVLVLATFVVLGKGSRWLLVAGLLTAAAYLTKSAGILIVPAVLMDLLSKRNWRGAAWFLGPVLPAVGLWAIWSSQHKSAAGHSVLAYYTDYIGYHLQSGGLAALPEIIPANLVTLCGAAGSLVLHDLSESILGRFLSILVAAAVVTGGVRWARRTGMCGYPVFCALLAALLCGWNFSPSVRLMLPMMPLVAVGLYLEGQNFARLTGQALRGGGANRVVAWMLMGLAGYGAMYAAQHNFTFIHDTIPGLREQAGRRNAERAPVYAWMRANLPAQAVVMASEDTLLYLNTGFRSVRPVPESVAFYRQDRAAMLKNFTHPESLERAFGVTHILLGAADFSTDFDPPEQKEAIRRLRENRNHRLLYEAGNYAIFTLQQASPVQASPGPGTYESSLPARSRPASHP